MRAVSVAMAGSIALWAGPALAADALTIADIAPQNSALVVGVDDFASMQAAFDRTGLKDIMDDPSVKAWFKEATQEATDHVTQMLESINTKMEDLSPPTGAAGFAVWMQDQKEETDPPFGFISMGDFGDNAQKMHDTLVAAFEKGEEQKQLTMKREDFGDTEIYTLTQLKPEKEEADDQDEGAGEEGDDWEDWEGWEDDASSGPTIETVYYAKVGSRLMASSVLENLENAIDRIGGKKLGCVGDSEQFHSARAQIGAHDGYAVLLTDPLYEAAGAADKASEAASGSPGFTLPLLDALGIVEVHAVSMGLKFDTPDGMMESRYGVLTPKMRGILSLFDAAPASFTPPAFIPADSATYTMVQVKFNKIMDVAQEVVQGLPANMAQQYGMMLGMAQGFAGPVLNALGSEMHMTAGYARPYSAESKQTLMSITATDAEALNNTASQAMVSRDFQGTQIWTMPPDSQMGSMMPMPPGAALAVGFGNLFIGTEQTVENALRLASQGGKEGAATLANEKAFQRAAKTVAPQGFAFSYTNIQRTVDFTKWYMAHYDEIMKDQMQKMMGDIEDPEIRKMMEDNVPEKPAWMKDMPNLDVIAKNMGDTVSESQRSDDGMRGRTIWLRPEK